MLVLLLCAWLACRVWAGVLNDTCCEIQDTMEQGVLSVSVLVQIDPAEFDRIFAIVKKQLFNDSVPMEEHKKLQQVTIDALQSLMQNTCLAQVLQCSMMEARCQWAVQENSRLVSECKRAEDLAASRQAALEKCTSLLSQMKDIMSVSENM